MLTGPCTRILTQMRLGLSSLRGQLFNYNLTDNPFCSYCLEKIESVEHFLFACGHFSSQRVILKFRLGLYLPDIGNFSDRDLSIICLTGCEGLEFESNYNVFRSVTCYLQDSKRFILF